MKKLIVGFIFLIVSVANVYSDVQWDNILKKYVDDKGFVNYQKLKENRKELDDYVKDNIQNKQVDKLIKQEQKTFWINTYNALTVQLIINYYPIKSIRKIAFGRPWSKKHLVGGGKKTLDDIEHKILRKWDPSDPRVHFAVNCASIGCPILLNESFKVDILDNQLDKQAKVFINSESSVRVDKNKGIVYLSSIFKWYKKDFITETTTLIDYILKYREADKEYLQKNKDKIKIKFIKYDWNLNKQI